MVGMGKSLNSIGEKLNAMLTSASLDPLDEVLSARFEDYLALLVKWNGRINLTAIRDEEGVLARHFVESIACAKALPADIGTLLDFGSGGGFPGVPIALCRPEIAVTLAESQGKKAAFLQEAVRVLDLPATVHAGRAESLSGQFDCVTLRAVDRMQQAIRTASGLVAPAGWLALMTTSDDLQQFEGELEAGFSSFQSERLPGSITGILAIARRRISSQA
jgi:16S rRNA (guanine527-N7)-methyltransferase